MWPIAFLLLQGAAPAQPPAQRQAPLFTQPCGRPDPAFTSSAPTRTPYQVLEAEHARGADLLTLQLAVASSDTVLQRLGARALGRTEQETWVVDVLPLLHSPAASVRREAVLAGTQMRAVGFGMPCVTAGYADPDPGVRALVYAGAGRTAPPSADWERLVAAGLRDSALVVQRGAARGLEALYRRGRRQFAATDSMVQLLERTAAGTVDREFTLLAAMARHAAMLSQPASGRTPLGPWVQELRSHSDAQVRRLATMMSPHDDARRDPSALVRLEMLRPGIAVSVEQLAAALRDTDEHVRLLAIDRAASIPDAAALLRPLTMPAHSWRTRAHAVLSLARLDKGGARAPVRTLARSRVWQARAWAARAAVVIGDTTTLRSLARDIDPNVRLEALTSAGEALAALTVDHAGLLTTAAEFLLKQTGDQAILIRHSEAAARAFSRVSRSKPVTWRDARVALFKLVVRHSQYTPSLGGRWMAQWLRDPDPSIQRMAVEALPALHPAPREVTSFIPHVPPPYVPPPFASEAELSALRGATVELRIRGKGTIVLALWDDVAPMTVVTFARLADRGAYNGRTLHRVVPNFVVQGGSPGADEYDPATDFFMRDEVGASNIRGSLGISTRGRDTGDGQIYFNLVDNVRLDFDYTVFANTVQGMAVMDRIQEGDVIESVVIRRVTAKRSTVGGH